MAVTAKDIQVLLEQRHSDDIYVPSCKTGPTPCPILDGWAMTRSWSNHTTHGYEIKVSRNDFLRDEKWREYLYYCHRFSFVAPKGLILPDELPPEVGLIESSTNCKMLITRKKAVDRKNDIPATIYMYILMWRATIHHEKTQGHNTEYWLNWLNNKDFRSSLGRTVSKEHRVLANEIDRRNKELERKHKDYDRLLDFLKTIGIDPSAYPYWGLEHAVETALKNLRKDERDDVIAALTASNERNTNLIKKLARPD